MSVRESDQQSHRNMRGRMEACESHYHDVNLWTDGRTDGRTDGWVGASVDACMAAEDCRRFGMEAIRKGFHARGTDAEQKAPTKISVTRPGFRILGTHPGSSQDPLPARLVSPPPSALPSSVSLCLCLPASSALPLLSCPRLSPSICVCPHLPHACPLGFRAATLFRTRSVCLVLLGLRPFPFVSFGPPSLLPVFPFRLSHFTAEET
jgi:hypothetical protein